MAGINTLLVREWLATLGITSGAVTPERAYRENAGALGQPQTLSPEGANFFRGRLRRL
jgi:hypothetical protein